MAESIVSDIAVDLIPKVGSLLGSLLLNEIVLLWGVKDELGKLEQTVETIKSVLLDAEEQSNHNHQVKEWLGKLSEAMYDADDLLDDFSYEALRQQVMGGVRVFLSSSNQLVLGLKMAHKVKALRERLDEIAASRKFHLDERPYVERRFVRDQTHSSPPEVVIGREQEKEAIVKLLLSADYAENVSVIPIVGFGGLGKTTLAQMVYNDDRVENHFELKMWVCVSDDFDVKSLVKKILESVNKKAPELDQMDPLKVLLHEKINGRRYLLVLDDVWNEDVNKWSSFKDLLVGGARGSKIMITTRLRSAAEMSRPISIHEIGVLSENESWSLFQQVAFKPGQLPNPTLEAVGKKIVAKCCGVPLAVKTIGGMLYFKDSDSDWVLFKDKELSTIDVFKNDILPILQLSYNHLPSHYKHCFAFCSLYPKDSRIPVEELIQLWKANGYVMSTDLNESVQDEGYGYFMDLYRMSFFQEVEVVFDNMYCKMHDLMHGLAVSVAGDNFYAPHLAAMKSISEKTKHVKSQEVSSMLKAKRIRSAISVGENDFDHKEIKALVCNLRCLRYLDLSRKKISVLPNSISKLKHLRHLDLSRNEFKKLPDSITNLHNLEVLDLKGCGRLKQLPSNITRLCNLTDLDNEDCDKLSHMPQGIGKLTKLEKLPVFVIARDCFMMKHVGGLNELHSLNNLRGGLEIKNLSYVRDAASEFMEAHLSMKQKLEKLNLDWERNNEDENNCLSAADEEKGMEALCPHPNLKELRVFHYSGVKPPSWLPSLINLVSVTFSNCESMERLPPFDGLPHLKTLCIFYLTNLKLIDVENGGGSFFPSLTYLTLHDCPNLMGFERREELLPCFPCLSWLQIRGCPNLTCLPLFPELILLNLSKDVIMKMATDSASPCNAIEPLNWLPSLSYLMSVCLLSCNNIERLPPLDRLPHLKKLEIYSLVSLKLIDVENGGGSFFPSLTDLTLRNCPDLMGFERREELLPCFPCLSRLEIGGCPNLTCLPLFPELNSLNSDGDGMKTVIKILKMRTESTSSVPFSTLYQLQHLEISYMENPLEDELLQCLPSLQILWFSRCPLTSVCSDEKDDGMHWQSLKVLHSVAFRDMRNLVALPKGLQYVTSLQDLEISHCPRLACIPEWMPKLPALKELHINNSPKLEERCRNNKADDWPYISDIPNIIFGDIFGLDYIQRDGCYLI